jgi:hypothetical protein
VRLRSTLAAHPVVTGALALTGIGLAVFVLAYFEPQKLFIDDRVDEALPTAPAAPAPPATPAAAAAPPKPALQVLSNAGFRSYEHETSGRAKVIELASGRRYVRFERFETSNGPDVKVYLSAAPASGPGDTFDDRYVSLGELKGNIGNQNYAIPAGVDLSRYRSAVIWCKRFHVPFAAAPLRVT